MKTIITKTIIALALSLSASVAAAEGVPAWICNLNFNGVSTGVQVIVGFSEFKGAGNVSCLSASGAKVEYPVVVKMKASPVAPRISLGRMHLYGEALQVAISNGTPEALLGNYVVAQGRAAIIGGVGVITAVRAADENLSLSISLQLTKGLGIDLGFSKLKIELDQSRMN